MITKSRLQQSGLVKEHAIAANDRPPKPMINTTDHNNLVDILPPNSSAFKSKYDRKKQPANISVNQSFITNAFNHHSTLKELITPLISNKVGSIAIIATLDTDIPNSQLDISLKHISTNRLSDNHSAEFIKRIHENSIKLFSPFQALANQVFRQPYNQLEFVYTLGSPVIMKEHSHGHPTINLAPEPNSDPTILSSGQRYHKNLPAYIPTGALHRAPAMRPIITVQPTNKPLYDLDI